VNGGDITHEVHCGTGLDLRSNRTENSSGVKAASA